MSWFSSMVRKARRQREAVEAIKDLGLQTGPAFLYNYAVDSSGDLHRDALPPTPAWLRRLFGDDFFATVVYVNLSCDSFPPPAFSDEWLEHIEALTGVETLMLNQLAYVGRPRLVTDAALVHVKGLRRLKRLRLSGTDVTDAGLEDLKGLKRLKDLTLSYTYVTDAGLRHLTGLPIEKLDLSYTGVTYAGLVNLGICRPSRRSISPVLRSPTRDWMRFVGFPNSKH